MPHPGREVDHEFVEVSPRVHPVLGGISCPLKTIGSTMGKEWERGKSPLPIELAHR